MKLVSVNTGLPREVTWHERSVTTAIYKQPVEGRVALRKLNLDGDRQADLSVHGGEYKAVHCYPIAHYDYWRRGLPNRDRPMAVFGENFTTDGLLEASVNLGDQFSIGSAEVIVTQPRLPSQPASKTSVLLVWFPGTIVVRCVAILNSTWYEQSDLVTSRTPKKQKARTLRPGACVWAGRIPGVLQ